MTQIDHAGSADWTESLPTMTQPLSGMANKFLPTYWCLHTLLFTFSSEPQCTAMLFKVFSFSPKAHIDSTGVSQEGTCGTYSTVHHGELAPSLPVIRMNCPLTVAVGYMSCLRIDQVASYDKKKVLQWTDLHLKEFCYVALGMLAKSSEPWCPHL